MNNQNKTFLFFLIVILLSIITTTFLYQNKDKILELQIPIWHGDLTHTDGRNYIVEGIFLGYGDYIYLNSTINKGNFIWIDTRSTIIRVSIYEMQNNTLYKKCEHITGDKIKYIGMFKFNSQCNMLEYFVLKREIC